MSSVASAKQEIVARLNEAGIEQGECRVEAELILEHVTGLKLAEQLAYPERELSQSQLHALNDLVAQRRSRKPLQYLLGHCEFMGLRFNVRPGVLIPRPETEILVEQSLNLIDSKAAVTVADIGSGSGAIAVCLAKKLLQARVYAIDISPVAQEVTRENAALHGVSAKVEIVKGDWKAFQPLVLLDAIISNPPYVPRSLASELQPEVAVFEPNEAVFGTDDDGLGAFRDLSGLSWRLLKEGGFIALEMGAGQSQGVADLFENEHWNRIEIHKDLAGIDRVLTARKT